MKATSALLISGLFLLTATVGVQAAPELVSAPGDYREDLIPANANCVAHIDLDHLRGTTLWTLFEEHRAELDLSDLDELKEQLGFDPLIEIRSVTAYKTGDTDQTVAVVVTSDAIDSTVEGLPGMDGYRAITEAGIDFFAFEDVVGSVHNLSNGDRAVIVAETLDEALRGHRVVHGDVKSQGARDEGVLRARPQNGSFFFFAAKGDLPGLSEELPASSVFELAQGIRVDLGEAGGALFASVGVDTGSLEDAQNVTDMVGGFLAMGKMLAHSRDEVPREVLSILRTVNVSSRGSMVSIDLRIPLQVLLGILQDMEHSSQGGR